ncbi:energy-coupling factor ABC transporter permease [Pseudoalteromonas sp. Z9A5]|uniref:energy-coupling factor ABC transporter permease n=1 Tax=Pseudoalteromonas sp. Z9A5 TaxID=2686355 RepID=UPI001407E946|nr:energy-coupling factor ABC transporter permease [Pseudoalteromonas sp. Z9A5]
MLSLQVQGLLWAVVAIASLLSFDKATYKALYSTPVRQTGVLACALVFAILWRIKAGILTGLDLHILGVTAATLILGWRLTILSSLLATALLASFGKIEPELLPVQILIGAFIPIALSYLAFIVSYHYLPRHFFVYIFVCAFITAGFIACIKIALGALFYLSIGQYNWQELTDNYVYLSAIIWFPEAMLNGMAITIMITYRPHWVKTFYDKDYLDS